jgi:LysR family cys regulon transcriptional activator
MVVSGAADLAIATEGMDEFEDIVVLPCYQWNHCLVAPPGLPILREEPLTLEAIAAYPIVTYELAFAGRMRINDAFSEAGLRPNVVLAAIDADVIKTYVELGLGVGLIASMAFDKKRDTELRMRDVSHLFAPSTTRIGLRRAAHLRGFTYAFIEMFAKQLDRRAVDEAMGS